MTVSYALRPAVEIPTIYLYRPSVDFRKSHRGLAAIVEMELGHDPFSGVLYVFRNRAFNKLKIVFWENNGFVLYYKSLVEDKFHWPSTNDLLLSINGEQLNWLLNGFDLDRMKPHKTRRYESVCWTAFAIIQGTSSSNATVNLSTLGQGSLPTPDAMMVALLEQKKLLEKKDEVPDAKSTTINNNRR